MRLSRIRYVNIHIVCIMYVVMREMRLSRITYEEIHLFYIRQEMVREMRLSHIIYGKKLFILYRTRLSVFVSLYLVAFRVLKRGKQKRVQ